MQVLLNCGGEDNGWGKAGNCHEGGSATSAYAWAKNFGGYPSATCFPYAAEDGLGCSGDTICRNCMPTIMGSTRAGPCPAMHKMRTPATTAAFVRRRPTLE